MPGDWVPEQQPYLNPEGLIALRPETFARHENAVRAVEGANNARYPRAGRGRTTSTSAGAWGMLASGATITAGSGLTLGSGTVTLCTRSGSTLTSTGETVTVYNAGDAITASGGDKAIRLSWVDAWVASKCG